MTTFCDNLREAKGFDNHVLVKRLGETTKQSLIGRVPAISKKRTGAIDLVLRDFRRVVEGMDTYDIPESAFALIDWSNTGAGGHDGEKKTISFNIESTLREIMEGEEDESGERMLVQITALEFAPRGDHFIPVGPAHALTDAEEEKVDEADERLAEHPIGALLKSLILTAMRHPEIKFMGTNDRLLPTTWYFSRRSEEEEYFAVQLHREEFEEEFELVTEV